MLGHYSSPPLPILILRRARYKFIASDPTDSRFPDRLKFVPFQTMCYKFQPPFKTIAFWLQYSNHLVFMLFDLT
uniref:Ovule protein n=1 Tax=Angiostrongylus cantonensis TaxID=6313 RepID=A0A0K0DD82_ANGCA